MATRKRVHFWNGGGPVKGRSLTRRSVDEAGFVRESFVEKGRVFTTGTTDAPDWSAIYEPIYIGKEDFKEPRVKKPSRKKSLARLAAIDVELCGLEDDIRALEYEKRGLLVALTAKPKPASDMDRLRASLGQTLGQEGFALAPKKRRRRGRK